MDDAHVARMYRHWAPLIHRHCRRFVGEAADDVTQEVFVRLWRHRSAVRGEEDGGWPLSWVYRVATNACLNHVRQHRRTEASDALDARRHHGPAPDESAAARADLTRLLGPFDDRTRGVVLLVLGAGFTQDEAAGALGLSRRTVGTRLKRFLAHTRGGPRPAADRATHDDEEDDDEGDPSARAGAA